MVQQHPPASTSHHTHLVGQSPDIQALRQSIARLVAFDTPGNSAVPTVLLQGETGTGKGLVARTIHSSGPRASGPYVEVNCAAIPDTLLEAELFGFEAGAFTDAKRPKAGLFEAATGGALFLDEIDALPLALQGKLLTAIEEKRFRRLGAIEARHVDVKLIVATQADLSRHVAAGRFRADLYYRLAVVLLTVPPLRLRGDDIALLAQHFLEHYADVHGVRLKSLSPAAVTWLCHYDWPGNVRELSHLLERVTLLHAETSIAPDMLERLVLPRPQVDALALATSAAPEPQPHDEAERIRQVLRETGGNVLRAARLLGISRGALRYRMQLYGLERRRETDTVLTVDSQEPTVSVPPRRAAPPRSAALIPAVRWEQKMVVVLAIDVLLPSAEGLVVTTPYEPWTLVTAWERGIAEKVQGFGGVLVQHTASLFVGLFGLPRALEQMPLRAVQAAFSIHNVLAEQDVTEGVTPEVRVAGHLGAVLVDTQTNRSPGPWLAVGETLSLPVRLLGHAAAGEVLVSAHIGRLLEGVFECHKRPVSLGATTPLLEVYAVRGLRSRRSRLAGLGARPRSRFVGRDRELAALHALLAHVTQGRGQVIGIVGEAGLGKSRLLYEFHESFSGPSKPVTYLEGFCLSYGSVMPYLPILDLLRYTCDILETDTIATVVRKVHAALENLGIAPENSAPYLLQLLGVTEARERLSGLPPETIKARAFELLRQMCFNASQRQPLIITIENVHWIDKTSEDFIHSLVDSLAQTSILFLATYRPGYRPPWLDKSYATQLSLQPLAAQESLQVVQSLCPSEPLPAPLTQTLLGKAEGNPFLLEEMVQALLDQNVFAKAGQNVLEVQFPATVQGVLSARMDRLDDAAKALLQTVAVFGRDFSWRLLRQVVDYPEDDLRRLLATLQHAEFLYAQPTLLEPEYTFKHALTQEVAYQSLRLDQRMALHERTAQAIERLFHDRLEEYYSELAHHYHCSGNTILAVTYLQRAGQQAAQRSAYTEAISHLHVALELLNKLPDTPERLQHELTIQTTLGPALIVIRGQAAPEVQRVYARARALCREAGETSQLFPVLWGLWVYYVVRAELQTARELAEQLLALGQRSQDTALLLAAYRALGVTLFWRGEFAAAQAYLEQGINLYDLQQHRALALLYGEDLGVGCLAYAACATWLLGYPARALAHSDEALALARRLEHPVSLARALTFAAALHHLRREPQAAQAKAQEAMSIASTQGFAFWLGESTLYHGWALAELGQTEAGIAQMQQGLHASRATGAEVSRPYWLVPLAAVYGKAGQAEVGLGVLTDMLAATSKADEHYYGAELLRLRGELLLQDSATETVEARRREAESNFAQALDIARQQQAKALELRAAMGMGRLWSAQGKTRQAYQLVADVYHWFTEGLETADLQEARQLLAEFASRLPERS